MPEPTGEGVNMGEGTPSFSPNENNNPSSNPNPGENPSNTGEGGEGGGAPKMIPYERFQEIVNEKNALNERVKYYDENIAPVLESLRTPVNEEPEPVDYNQFQSPQELVDHINKGWEEKLNATASALEQKFYAQQVATEKLAEAREQYPELKTDPEFRNMVVTKLRSNPNLEIGEICRQTRDYLTKFEQRGRQAATQEMIEKGFTGVTHGNRPMQTDEDKALVKDIVGSTGNSGVFR